MAEGSRGRSRREVPGRSAAVPAGLLPGAGMWGTGTAAVSHQRVAWGRAEVARPPAGLVDLKRTRRPVKWGAQGGPSAVAWAVHAWFSRVKRGQGKREGRLFIGKARTLWVSALEWIKWN